MTPLILPLGDHGLLVRFGDAVTDEANLSAIALSVRAETERMAGVLEVVPNLISVLFRYDPGVVSFDALARDVRPLVSAAQKVGTGGADVSVPVTFDGDDLVEVAALLGRSSNSFVASHNSRPLRVLATGFAPGFIYCGMHSDDLVVPRRVVVRRQVPAGTVLFAAGQTAITSTPIPTGWHVIGHTAFRNFDPAVEPPSTVVAGDTIRFEAA